MSTVVCGQDEAEVDEAKKKVEAQAISSAVREQYKRVLLRGIRNEVTALETFFKLSDADARRLQLAAKGAVKETVDANADKVVAGTFRKLRGATLPNITLNGRAIGKPTEKREPSENQAADEKTRIEIYSDWRQTFVLVQRAGNRGYGGTDVGRGIGMLLQQDVWVRTRDSLLTKDQLEQFAKHRQELRRRYVAEAVATRLAMRLSLPMEDRDRLLTLVRNELKSSKLVPDPSYRPKAMIQLTLKELNYDKLKSVLSADQVAMLKSVAVSTQVQSSPGF